MITHTFAPGSPGVPGLPTGPFSPGGPGSPFGPGSPGGPWRPSRPIAPVAPGGPGGPGGPGSPGSPCNHASRIKLANAWLTVWLTFSMHGQRVGTRAHKPSPVLVGSSGVRSGLPGCHKTCSPAARGHSRARGRTVGSLDTVVERHLSSHECRWQSSIRAKELPRKGAQPKVQFIRDDKMSTHTGQEL